MFGKAPRLLCIRKIIAVVTIAQFVLSSPVASFAAGDHLRALAAKNSPRVFDVRNALKKDGGTVEALKGWFIRVQSNMAGLFRGAQTGGINTYHAYEQGSNGNLIDHSENRERLEGMVKDMIIAMLTRRQGIVDATDANLKGAPKVHNLIVAKINRNSTLSDAEKQAQLARATADNDALMVKLVMDNDLAIKKLEGEYFLSTKEQMSRLERSTGLNAKNQELVLSWVRAQYANAKWSQESTLDELVAQITNRVKNQELQADVAFSKAYYKQYGEYPYKVTTLCLGEKKSQYDAQDPKKAWKILDRDLRQMLEGISLDDAQMLGLRLAYEPRWIIGADTIPADVLAKIDDTHAFIKEVSDELLGQELMVDYGAAVKEGTIESIMKLPHVDGVLIGSAANDPATLKPVILKAVAYAAKTGKVFNLGINWKASDSTSGLKDLDAFVALFKGIEDLDKISITIATPNVRETRTAMDQVETYFSRISLTGLKAKITEVIHLDSTNSFTMDVLALNEKGESAIRGFFGEEPTNTSDRYLFLKKNGIVFALAKENALDQTLMVVPVDDMAVAEARDAYYANLLESVSLLTSNTGKGIELITENGDLFKRSIASSSQPKVKKESFSFRTLAGIKYWYGRERFFQMEYKPVGAAAEQKATLLTFKDSDRKIARGVSMIVQPKITHMIFGFGTIGSQIAQASRKMGFFVVAINRSPNDKALNAVRLDIPLYVMKEQDKEAFAKAGIPVAGTMEELAASGVVELITDATDGKTKHPKTGKEITVAEYNVEFIYKPLFPNAKGMFQGAEDPEIATKFFDSGTLNKLHRSFAGFVKGVASLFVPSCNTTGQGFIEDLLALNAKEGTLDMIISTHRRANDPGQKGKLSPDGTTFETDYHHADDYLAGRKDFPEIMKAFKKVGMTQADGEAEMEIAMLSTDASLTHLTKFHISEVWIVDGIDKETGKPMTVESVTKYLSAEPRIALVKAKKFDTTTMIDVLQRNNIVHPFTPIISVYKERTGRIKIMMANPQESVVIPNNMNGLQALAGVFETAASMRLVNEVLKVAEISERIENTAPLKSARVKTDAKDGGEVDVATPIDYLTLDDVDVNGRTVWYRGDFNSPVENGKLRITERMRANAVSIKEMQQKGARQVISVHQGRKGDADYLENVEQYADLLSELIGAKVKYVDDLYGPAAIHAIRNLKNGEVLILKNVRSWDPETAKKMTLDQQAQSDMVKALSPLIDFEVLDAFSIAHRNNISVVGFEAAGIPLIAGRLMEKEIKGNYRAALVGEKPYIASFGGAKIDDYLGVIRKGLNENIYTTVHTSGLLGELALVAMGFNLGKPTTDFLEEQFKDFTSKKYGNGMQAIVKEIKDLLSTYGSRIEVPVDLAYLDANGKRVEVVLTAEHKTKAAADTLIGDVGTQTANIYAAQLKEAKTVFVKGPWGNYKNVEFIGASDIIAKALNESKAYLITGGGDTNVLFERLGMMERINYFSLAGGAFLEFMEGKALPGLVALDHSAKSVLAGAQKVGVSKIEYLKHVINAKFLHTNLAGDTFNDLVSSIEKAKAAQKGELSTAQWSAAVIKDSRGKPTVKAVLQIGDIEVEGYVPAGTSTGDDEANTVDPVIAMKNIVEKIAPMLAKANLDLGKHEDLVKADRMLQEAAGKNFIDLGANATLPVSWALWKMAAKLHNMPLWLYFRMYEPRAVGNGRVYNSFNFGNGGEHSLQDPSEILGVDRMFAQEVKYVTVGAKTERESLAEADIVDQIYKKKLIALAGAENVTRALERGLTAKGIADIYVMTDLLIQSGIEAGKKPGKDFRIAVDFAANSVYNRDTKRYFINEQTQLTAPEMRKFIRDYADAFKKKYDPDIFLYFEDPLAENEWAETALLTPELKERGILLTGDDLFVTQVRKVAIGVDIGAGTAVLIKPNQVGTITGMIDTVEYAHENGLETVFSHRSGETLDKALADAAKGFLPLAIKTGAPQPESEYPNQEEWERRNKYLRKIEIQEEEAILQKALVIGPDFFAAGGVSALKQALALNKQVQFVLYGETIESVKALLGDVSILTTPTLTDAVALLKARDVAAQNIIVLGSAPQEDADAVKDIRQIPIQGIGTIALAQALNALLADEATQAAFSQFDKAMADFKVDAAVAEQVDQAIRDEEEFFNKV